MKHTVLFLAASPRGTAPLALGEEARAIQVELERSGYRDCFELKTRWAAQPLDLLRELRKLKPTVVHFSGHGGQGPAGAGAAGPTVRRDVIADTGPSESEPRRGLFFQGGDGQIQVVTAQALHDVFAAAGSSVKLVVLSACYSDVQAEALRMHVDCVVGMNGSFGDDAARNFAIGFYGGLGECESVAAAYRQGCAAITLEGLRDGDRPQLRVRDGIDASKLVLAERGTSLTRRTAVAGLAGAAGAVIAAVGLSPLRKVFVWSGLGELSVEPNVEMQDLFPSWGSVQIVPGNRHPDFGFHPDIVTVMTDMLNERVMIGKFANISEIDRLEEPNCDGDMLLIGGPVSNGYSRLWRGFEMIDKRLIRRGNPNGGMRWEFNYPDLGENPVMPVRFVDGKPKSTWIKEIVDHKTGEIRRSQWSLDMPIAITEGGLPLGATPRWLEQDFLLITCRPSPWTREAGRMVIDIADLHGQGDKAFVRILTDKDLRRELLEATVKRGVHSFQALYSVRVRHQFERRQTHPDVPRLIAVHALT
jgi:hypothetical protein